MMNAELVLALQAAVDVRDGDEARADVATLEAAIEILEEGPIVCDLAETGQRPRANGYLPIPCSCAGVVYQRQCADCGYTVTRCEAHGGNKSVSRWQFLHRERHEGIATKASSMIAKASTADLRYMAAEIAKAINTNERDRA